MLIDATLLIRGSVEIRDSPPEPSQHGACVFFVTRGDAFIRKLYIDGTEIGTVPPDHDAIRPDVEAIYKVGQSAPVDWVIYETEIDCVLELPTRPAPK